jgi:mRNA interferase YafQ
MFKLQRTTLFIRDLAKYLAKGGSEERLEMALECLRSGKELPPWFRDHALRGTLRGMRELHLEADWLLIYRKDGKKFIIMCLWLVTHKKLRERERSL